VKNIRRFNQFSINESQSKKIRDYVDFSTFLDWFNKNRPYIAHILECDEEDIISEEDLLKQSSELIDLVINPQERGNRGRDSEYGDGVDLSGFKRFDILKNKIIHDILHNIYAVTEKEFGKGDYDFSESEFIEEIEVLAIEESFVKYFTKDYDYVKPDFINQNINRLVSFLMMSIIREDGERIAYILDGKTEPYIEVYDKQYPIKDTPFQNLFEMFKQIPINPVKDSDQKIETGQDFKDWLGWMVLYGEAIDYGDNANRAQFPYSNFLGAKDLEDLDDEETKQFLDQHYYYVVKEEDVPGLNVSYDDEINGWVAFENEPDLDVESMFADACESTYGGTNGVAQLPEEHREDLYDNRLDKSDEEVKWVYKIEIDEDDIPWDVSNFFSKFDIADIKWIVETEYTTNSGDKTDYYYVYDNEQYIGMKEGIWDGADIDEMIVSRNDVWDKFMENQWDYVKDIDEEINDNNHTDDIDKNVRDLFNSDNGLAITRRYFRYNDVLVNNTKLDVDPESEYYEPVKDTLFDDYISLSKHLITDNAKNLKKIFDTFRGWTIKNFDSLKKTKKKMNRLFSPADLNLLNDFEKFFKMFSELRAKKSFRELLNNSEYVTFSVLRNDFKEIEEIFDKAIIYRELFRKIGDEKTLAYLKRLPKVTDPELFRKHRLAFEDMILDVEIESYKKSKNIFSKISNINGEEITKYLRERRKSTDSWSSRIRSFNYRNLNKFLDDVKLYVSDVLDQDVEIVTEFVRPILDNDGFISEIEYKPMNVGEGLPKIQRENWMSSILAEMYMRTKRS
jgi:hypothetical protein